MAHEAQIKYLLQVKSKFPERFINCRVLDIGSLDLNGNNRYLFDSPYTNDYYKNLGIEDIDKAIDFSHYFKQYEFTVQTSPSCDLYFWGIKK